MIPLQLTISGFLSYRDEVTLDFRGFDLACIAGANGAGKSSLLDAITWALFGQARRRDESVINLHKETTGAHVTLDFSYEGNTYRAQRSNPRGKSTMLEFHIQTLEGNWKPLTERSTRNTQNRIEEILRLDYETFVNAAFFLQGNADQFTQQSPGNRKRILGNILGLEIWETYRQGTVQARKEVDVSITGIDGRLHEITSELAEEEARKTRLKELEDGLQRLAMTRKNQESMLENMRKLAATLDEQNRLVESLSRQLKANRQELEALEERQAERKQERNLSADLLSRASEIEQAHAGWQKTKEELTKWDETATRFHEHEKRRHEPLTLIETERTRLETERDELFKKRDTHKEAEAEFITLDTTLGAAKSELEEAEKQLERRETLNEALQDARQRQAEAHAENPRLRDAMNELMERIKQLEVSEGATCPLCGQPLSQDDRLILVKSLNQEGKEKGDRYRENDALLQKADALVADLQSQISELHAADAHVRAQARKVDQISDQMKSIQDQAQEWEQVLSPRLEGLDTRIREKTYAEEARTTLAKIDAELKETGYDAKTHDQIRQQEQDGRGHGEEFRNLEKAQAKVEPLEREIGNLEEQINARRETLTQQQQEHDDAAARLAAAQEDAPNLDQAEQELLSIQEQENRLRMEVGAARQKVDVLDDLRTRRNNLESERETLANKVGQYKQLERAFSKDGVPALLIEQALPQLEDKANELLDRLSNGTMSVRFQTQRAYKDKKREDLRETLDIQISDSAGVRDYEMYSGGEAFRVNFAIRLALSEILSQRAGARLQTLVIDEGFGSQDAIGRQRLVEAINMVRDDFAKILVITHIEELKDAFPTRIEVEKGARGSIVTVN